MAKTNALRLLDQAGIEYRTVYYSYDTQDLDVAKIALENGLALAQIFKTLVCKGDKTGPVVAVVPGDRQLSLKLLAKASGNKKIAMLPLSDLTKTTGYMRGGCSPVGMKKKYPVFIDQSAQDWAEILINAGARGTLFGCSPNEISINFAFQKTDLTG